jgi:hypothetical protein
VNCYDCATQDHLARPAIGVCHDCGAAACESHAVTRAHHLTRIATILREETIDPAARVLRCTTCDTAYVALHHHTRPFARPATPSAPRTVIGAVNELADRAAPRPASGVASGR